MTKAGIMGHRFGGILPAGEKQVPGTFLSPGPRDATVPRVVVEPIHLDQPAFDRAERDTNGSASGARPSST
jgi:hypothetical protein